MLALNKPSSSSSSCLPPPTRVARSRSEFSSFTALAMQKPLSSSATGNQVATLDFVQMLPGRKLIGSLCVMHSITAKDKRHVSAFPGEEELLFPPNAQFKVDRVVTSAADKATLLSRHTA